MSARFSTPTPTMLLAVICTLLASVAIAADAPQYRGGPNHPGSSAESADLSGATPLTHAYSMNTGTSAVFADPIVISDNLIIANDAGDVICLDVASGSPRWTKNVGSPIRATPVAGLGRVSVGTLEGLLVTFDLTNGAELWRVLHGGQMFGSPVLADGKLIVAHGFGNDHLTAYDPANGTVIWTRALSRYSQASPAVYGDRVIVAQPDGIVMAYELATGAPAWQAPVETGGIFYGAAPCIVQDPDSTDILIFANPGDDEKLTGTTITGFQGYVTYRIKLSDGTYARIVPGSGTSSALSGGRAAKASGGSATAQAPRERTDASSWHDCPPELRDELVRLSDLQTKLQVIGMYEAQWGIDLTTLKTGLQNAHAGATAYKSMIDLEIAEGKRSKAVPKAAVPLPASAFATNYPTAGMIRPAPAAYLARGTGRYLAIMMREIPTSSSVSPRTIVFSLNPSMNGTLRWMYATDQLPIPSAPGTPGALLIPKTQDANGAYLLAPLGESVGVFDAAANNTPLFQIDMQAPVYSTPILANGRLIVIDSGGHLRVFTTGNLPPTAPSITAPTQNANLTVLPDPTATWTAATDDLTAPGDLIYVIRHAVDKDFVSAFTDTVLPAGQTHYSWVGLPADSSVTFAVRTIDGSGAASAFSAPRTFTYLIDTTAPGPVGPLEVVAGPLSFVVGFPASADHPPNGLADVTNYRLTVTNNDTQAAFTLDLGTERAVLVNGALQATPLTVGVSYTLSVVAMDKRGNTSTAVTTTAIPLEALGVDNTPPTITRVELHDNDANGTIETVAVTFSEAISTSPTDFNPNGFLLNGSVVVSATPAQADSIILRFGTGIQGTGLMELTYNPTFGVVRDLAGNLLSAVGAADIIEIDRAAPVLLGSSVTLHDDNGDDVPNRITVRFTEALDPASVTLAALASVRDSQNTNLNATSINLLPDGNAIEVHLDGQIGVMGIATIAFNPDTIQDLAGNFFVGVSLNNPPVIVVNPTSAFRDFAPGLIALDASESSDPDSEGGALTFEWRIIAHPGQAAPTFFPGGETVLSGDFPIARFIATMSGAYNVSLVVADAGGASATSAFTIRVLNLPPIAVAGNDQNVNKSVGVIRLDGRASMDPNDSVGASDVATYTWSIVSRPAGPEPLIDSPTSATTSIDTTSLAVGTYVFRLAVTDGSGQNTTDTVTIRIFDNTNLPPSANAGPDRRSALGQPVRLDGRFSRDDSTLTYTWSQVSGPTASMGSATQARVTVVPAATGTHTFMLLVSDGTFTDTDTVSVEVFDSLAARLPGVLATAPATANANQVFEIDASATLALPGVSTSTPPIIDMVQISGPTLMQVGSPAPGRRTFMAASPGRAVIEITSSDGTKSSLPLRLTVSILVPGRAVPTATLTTLQTLAAVGPTTFDFSSSTGEGDLTVLISQTSGPVPSVLASTGPLTWNFEPGMSGTYVFEATIFDGVQYSAPYSFSITHSPAGSGIPTATPQLMSISSDGRSATVTASGATDPDGDTIGFFWIQIAGATAVIADSEAQTTAIDLPLGSGSYSFQLLVDDGVHQANVGVVTFSAESAPPAPVGASGGGCAAVARSGSLWLPLSAALLAVIALVVFRRRRTEA